MLLAEGLERKADGDYGRAAQALGRAAAIEAPPGIIDRPDSTIRAAFELGGLHLAAGNVDEAVVSMTFAMARRAYDPRYHLGFATALLHEGSVDAARLHADQAQRLARPDDAAVAAVLDDLRAMLARTRRPGAAPRYVV